MFYPNRMIFFPLLLTKCRWSVVKSILLFYLGTRHHNCPTRIENLSSKLYTLILSLNLFFLSNNKCQLYGWNKVAQMLFKWTQIQYILCGVYSAIAKVTVVGSPSYWQERLFRRCNTNISTRERIFIYSWITLLITFQLNFNSALFIYHLLQLRVSLGTLQIPRASLLNKQLWQEKTDSQLGKGREG